MLGSNKQKTPLSGARAIYLYLGRDAHAADFQLGELGEKCYPRQSCCLKSSVISWRRFFGEATIFYFILFK